MKDIEDILYENKNNIDEVEAPHEMEDRLISALDTGKKKKNYKGIAAVVVIAMLTLTYSYDVIGYYGKKLMGYDQVVSGSLKELRDQGRGQEINKSVQFSNGVEFTLDGIIFDENELVALYKLHSEDVPVDDTYPSMTISGIKPMGYHMQSGIGKTVDENTQVWTHTFEPPRFYEKWLTLNIQMMFDGRVEEKNIRFTLDRNAAMKRIMKQDINEKLMIRGIEVNFITLTASSLSTIVEGNLRPLNEQAEKLLEGKQQGLEQPSLVFDIFANGEKVEGTSRSMGSSKEGNYFKNSFNGLPKEFQTLELKNIRFENYKMIDKSVELTTEIKDLEVDEDLVVKRVYNEGDLTCITVSSSGIPVMGLFIGGEQIKTEDSEAANDEQSEQPVEKTFKYRGKGKEMKLRIKHIKYVQYSGNNISIPVK